MHALMKFGNSHIMMADACPASCEKGPPATATAGLFVYVGDCDNLFDRAVKVGCEVILGVGNRLAGFRL